jgi:hypothetical protein
MNRYSYAKSITRLIDRSENYYSTLRPFRIVHNPESVLAAKTDLQAISKRLDSSEPVNTKALGSLKQLLSDGHTSPLFRRNPEAAKRVVAEIRDELSSI